MHFSPLCKVTGVSMKNTSSVFYSLTMPESDITVTITREYTNIIRCDEYFLVEKRYY